MVVAELRREWAHFVVWAARRDLCGMLDRGRREEAAASSSCATRSEGVTDKQRSYEFYASFLPEIDPASFSGMATVVAAKIHIRKFDTNHVGHQCWTEFVRHYANQAADHLMTDIGKVEKLQDELKHALSVNEQMKIVNPHIVRDKLLDIKRSKSSDTRVKEQPNAEAGQQVV